MTARVGLTVVLVFAPMLLEAGRSRRHERRLQAAGAVEPSDDVIGAMTVAYPGAFLAMLVEGLWRAQGWDGWAVGGLLVFLAGKAIKYAAIRALGERWSFRVLVLPGAPLVRGGPYRWLRHPNYVGVVLELVGAALLCPSPVAGPFVTAGFVALLRRRIVVEERALGVSS